ncbi:hypothetical protein [Anditalea andensis]|uniref:PEGA domain-containing protein n=1 Tax=Anditalea andensis TaxID=1048983 RepID=A0A074KWF6_9BACT|nr:hypothetical protein [Anditalea andensis]KEO71943.1 hypothetical protein EL17_20725 [Anditalea andensis]
MKPKAHKNSVIISLMLISFFSYSVPVSAQNKIKLTSNHSDAVFSKMEDGDRGKNTPLGIGEISLKLEKNSDNKIIVAKAGYEPVVLEFPKTEKYEKEMKVLLVNRMVEVESNYDDAVFLNGEEILGRGKSSVIIPEGQMAEITVNKTGYVSKKTTYYNVSDKELPPVKEIFELKDRYVQLDIQPQADAYLINGKEMAEGTTGIVVPYGECVELKVIKKGYADVVQKFCNQDSGENIPPIIYGVKLEDRVVRLESLPADASIQVNGNSLAFGQYDLLLPKGTCFKVEVVKEGYISFVRTYCNQDTSSEDIPVVENVKLMDDEAYRVSIYSDKINHRIPIKVRKSLSNSEAWKILISIITKEYDVLETIDFNAGYLITAWRYDAFNNGGKTIRSRIIITNSGSLNESNYSVKFVSQTADGDVSHLEEAHFTDWDRIIRKYYELLEDMEIRLQ